MADVHYETVSAIFVAKTGDAVLLDIDDEEHWIPRSLLSTKSDRVVNQLRATDMGEAYDLQIVDWKVDELN